MSIMINEQVLGFKIPVDNFVLMEIEESKEYFDEIEFGIDF